MKKQNAPKKKLVLAPTTLRTLTKDEATSVEGGWYRPTGCSESYTGCNGTDYDKKG